MAEPATDQVDPASLRVLLVDFCQSTRASTCALLQECSYQVSTARSTQEALQLLKAQQGEDATAAFDLILKSHTPPSNAVRLLRRVLQDEVLRTIPVVVMSAVEDRDAMVQCLSLGAADYMIMPLRQNELRNLWARVYWWRRAFYLQQQAAVAMPVPGDDKLSFYEPVAKAASSESEETNCEEKERAGEDGDLPEGSREGSTPNGSGSGRPDGSGQGSGGEASKGADCCGRALVTGSADGCNGFSATKAMQGSNNVSATRNGNSGNGSTGQQETAALIGTAEGRNSPSAAGPPADFAKLNSLSSMAAGYETNGHGSATGHMCKPKTGDTCKPKLDILPLSQPSAFQHVGLQPSSDGSPQGFRAYVSKETTNRKRQASSSDTLLTSDAADANHSSGFRRTTSIATEGVKRQAIAAATVPRDGSGSSRAYGASGPIGSDSTNLPLHKDAPTKEQDTPASTGNFPNYYPYGMQPQGYGMQPGYWNGMAGEADMQQAYYAIGQQQLAAMVAQQQQQAQAQSPRQGGGQAAGSSPRGEMEKALHSQQMALQNQLLFQHNVLLSQMAPHHLQALWTQQQGQAWPRQQNGANGVQSGWQDKVEVPTVLATAANPGQAARQGSAAMQMAPAGSLFTDHGTHHGSAMGAIGPSKDSGQPTATGETGTAEPTRQERRAQALHKYKQKRKKLCFTKKIRYESRKQLAQARPRVKGQFVRVQSTDVGEIAEAIVQAVENGGAVDAFRVPQAIALRKVGGNTQLAAELVASAKQKLADEELEQGNEFEEDEEEGEVEGALGAEPEQISDEEDDGVTSPQDIHNRVASGGVNGGMDNGNRGYGPWSGSKASQASNAVKAPKEKHATLHSSNSGSNSPISAQPC